MFNSSLGSIFIFLLLLGNITCLIYFIITFIFLFYFIFLTVVISMIFFYIVKSAFILNFKISVIYIYIYLRP